MRKLYILIGPACLWLVAPVFAADADKPNAPPDLSAAWDIRPVLNRQGQFDFCLMDHSFTGGRKITIALSPQNEINLGVTIPGAGFSQGKHYDLALSFSKGGERKMRGDAVGADELLLRLGGDAKWAGLLASNDKIDVSGGANMVSFPLPNIAQAFGALQDCVKSSPMSAAQANKPAAPALPEQLQKLLFAAGLTNIQPIDMGNKSEAERPADYAWKTGVLFGGVRTRDVPKEKTLAQLAILHLEGLKEKCGGSFKSNFGKERNFSGPTMLTAEAECVFSGRDVFVAILYVLSPSGQFTVYTHEGARRDIVQAIDVRDRLAQAIMARKN